MHYYHRTLKKRKQAKGKGETSRKWKGMRGRGEGGGTSGIGQDSPMNPLCPQYPYWGVGGGGDVPLILLSGWAQGPPKRKLRAHLRTVCCRFRRLLASDLLTAYRYSWLLILQLRLSLTLRVTNMDCFLCLCAWLFDRSTVHTPAPPPMLPVLSVTYRLSMYPLAMLPVPLCDCVTHRLSMYP